MSSQIDAGPFGDSLSQLKQGQATPAVMPCVVLSDQVGLGKYPISTRLRFYRGCINRLGDSITLRCMAFLSFASHLLQSLRNIWVAPWYAVDSVTE